MTQPITTPETPEQLAERLTNDALLDLYDLTIANAPMSAADQRQLAEDVSRSIGKTRTAIATALQAKDEEIKVWHKEAERLQGRVSEYVADAVKDEDRIEQLESGR